MNQINENHYGETKRNKNDQDGTFNHKQMWGIFICRVEIKFLDSIYNWIKILRFPTNLTMF